LRRFRCRTSRQSLAVCWASGIRGGRAGENRARFSALPVHALACGRFSVIYNILPKVYRKMNCGDLGILFLVPCYIPKVPSVLYISPLIYLGICTYLVSCKQCFHFQRSYDEIHISIILTHLCQLCQLQHRSVRLHIPILPLPSLSFRSYNYI